LEQPHVAVQNVEIRGLWSNLDLNRPQVIFELCFRGDLLNTPPAKEAAKVLGVEDAGVCEVIGGIRRQRRLAGTKRVEVVGEGLVRREIDSGRHPDRLVVGERLINERLRDAQSLEIRRQSG
jgi:hypothetical protein